MKKIFVIGMGLSPDDLTGRHLDIIAKADVIIGGKRHLDFVKDHPALKKEITGDIKSVITYIKRIKTKNNIVVLASGDPLFYGIGSVLIKAFGKENVFIYPNITSVSAAFARIKEPWHDTHVLSLHGRNHEQLLLDAMAEKNSIAIFTDPENADYPSP